MGQVNGIRHVLFCLIGGIAEHHTLISGPDGLDLLVAHLVLLGFQGLVNTHGDIRGLLVNSRDHAAGLTVKPVFCPVIANLPDSLPDNLLDIHISLGGDLTHDHHQTRGHCRLTRHPAHGVLLQQRIQNRV